MQEKKAIQSVERSFAVIEAMSLAQESSVSQLSRDTGLNKTTVHRILNTLVSLGYAAKDSRTGKYSLSLKFLKLSANQFMHYDIHKKMRPLLERIAKISGETVHLVERQGETVVYIDKCESTLNSVRMVSKVGITLDVFTTAVGKAMLAKLTDREISGLWEKCPHEKKTQNTIISLSDYLREIEKVRRDGYAVDDEENELEVRCVAVAVPDVYDEYKYALSISAPKSRSNQSIILQRAQLLLKTVKEEL